MYESKKMEKDAREGTCKFTTKIAVNFHLVLENIQIQMKISYFNVIYKNKSYQE